MSDATSAIPGEAPRRPVAGFVLIAVGIIAVGLSLFQLYTAGYRPLNLFYQRGIHLALVLVLAFLLKPIFNRKRGVFGWLIDGSLIGASLATGGYLVFNLDAIINRAGFWTQTDITYGIIAVVVLLEASRRIIGITITIIGIVFIVYAMAGPRGDLPWLGQFLPGILEHRGYDIDRIVAQLFLGQEGIYGIPLGVAATVVFIFVLFGAFLEVTGGGQFFIDLAYAAAGRQRGGPAKAAVVASGFMGSISGSAIANVVTSGAFTIPLMKRLGYKPEEAGGVEAAASTGGQVMPPIMGAGAFLIAEYTQLPYLEIVKLSVLPAILYFATVFLFVDIIAAKRGMKGIPADELPKLRDVFRTGWMYLVPLGILIWFLLLNISPNRVGFIAIASIVGVSIARWFVRRFLLRVEEAQRPWGATLRQGAGDVIGALETGARNAVPVSIACAVAGVVVGTIGLTGLGLKFSSLMISFSGGNLLIALLLLILASLVLGMGLPVTASYIVLAVLAAPALTGEFGVPLVIAHLVIFWYSQDSNVTPPVALAAFAAAGVANANPMATGFQAWKFAKGLYLIPLFMVYNPEIIVGAPWPIYLWNVVTALAALGAFAAALEGYMFTKMAWFSRGLATIGMIAIFWPNHLVEVAGFAMILAVLLINWIRMRNDRNGGATVPVGSEPRGDGGVRPEPAG